ncbi:unnamed protein product [Ectocarpus sp. 12 AP-2014]
MQDARQTLLVPHCGSVDQRSSQIVSFSCLCNTSVLSQPIGILQPRQGQGAPMMLICAVERPFVA